MQTNLEGYQRLLNASIILGLIIFSTFFVLVSVSDTKDINIIAGWVDLISRLGWIQGYQESRGDYPPLFYATFYPFLLIPEAAAHTKIAINVSSAFYLLLSTWIIFLFTRNKYISILMYFSLYVNVCVLKYIDINSGVFLLLAVFFLQRNKFFLFGLLFSIACLVKWQPLVFAPFFLIYLYRIENQSKNLFKSPFAYSFYGCILVLVPCLVLFAFSMFTALNSVLNEPYISGKALNIQWVISYILQLAHPEHYGPLNNGAISYIKDESILLSMLKIPFIAAYLFATCIFYRSTNDFKNLIEMCLIGYLFYFILNTGVHENHLFFAVLMATVLTTLDREKIYILIPVIIALNVNMLSFYGTGLPVRSILGIDITLVFSLLLSIALLSYCIHFLKNNRQIYINDDALLPHEHGHGKSPL